MSQANTHRVRLQIIETLGDAEMTVPEIHQALVDDGYAGNVKSINSAMRLMVSTDVARVAGLREGGKKKVYALTPVKPVNSGWSEALIIPTVKLDPMAWIVATSGVDTTEVPA